ncbi:MAG TPA: aryl-sulfate sulfotransferase, partial [Bacteroidota bacterium]|nr:aryl-sulfate sulfotransferase [Bacteroidota bacterium]
NLIVRQDEAIGLARLNELRGAVITGSASGRHDFSLVVANDGTTALWTPAAPFISGETVTVAIPASRTAGGRPAATWSFTVSSAAPGFAPPRAPEPWDNVAGASDAAPSAGSPAGARVSAQGSGSRLTTGTRPDSVPSDFPALVVDTSNSPSPGAIFLSTTNHLAPYGLYAMAFDNTGNALAYANTSPYSSNDFKVQPNGLLSYARVTGIAGAVGIAPTTEIVMDSTFAVVDSFQCGNGYTADFHEFTLLPNGHAIMMAYDPQVVDMSEVVPGGKPNAVVYGSIIQELDAAKNVVFQWRSWDYIPITDCYDILTGTAFDYIHVNSIEVDTDGNFIVSCRETAEILKIDHVTGDIIWRWGGKHNQFTFIGDNAGNAPNYFSYQHDVRRIANGHITMMDNGNQHVPPYSRAAEYALDETAKTATLVWEYRHTPDVFNPAAGSVQRLPNGNTLIGWGTSNFLGVGTMALTEVRQDKSTALEMTLPNGLFSYRALRFPWKSGLPSATVSLLDLHPGVNYQFNATGQYTGVSVMITSGDAVYSRVSVTRYPFAPVDPSLGANPPVLAPARAVVAQAGFASYTATVTFDSTYTAGFPTPSDVVVYGRATEGSGTFSPLATTFDAGTRSLAVTTSQFGEYAFGWSNGGGAPTAPALYAPANGAFVDELLPLKLSWSSRGRALGYYIQAATDSGFTHLSVNDSTTTPAYTLGALVHDTTYFWRARAIGDSALSAWSARWRFASRAPFVGLTYPSGGETFYRDSSYVVRWQTNAPGKARLLLMSGSIQAAVIADSTPNSGAFLWSVPGTLSTGTVYRVSVVSLADTTVAGQSPGTFTVKDFVASVAAGAGTPQSFALEQNYPNPFNPATQIRYALPARATVTLDVYNALGQRIAALVNEPEDAGFHEVRFDGTNLASGVYFYRLRARASASPAAPAVPGDFVQTKKLLLVR